MPAPRLAGVRQSEAADPRATGSMAPTAYSTWSAMSISSAPFGTCSAKVL
jgi:hypothetical protein